MNKYEQLIEFIINENDAAAKELFHQIVVEKSRDIYESLMDEEIGGNASQQFVQDISGQDDAAQDQGLGEDDLEGADIELDGGDDEFGHDEETFGDEEGEFGGEESEHGDIETKLDDIAAELEELKALLGNEESGSGMSGSGEEPAGEFGGESDFDHEESGEESGEEEFAEGTNPFAKSSSGASGSGASGSGKSGSGVMEAKKGSGSGSGSGKSGSGTSGSGKSGSGVKESYRKSEVEIMKEYVDKIGEIYKQEPAQGEGKVVGAAEGGDHPNINKSGVVRKQEGKFDGETAENIATGGAEQNPDGKQFKKPSNEYSKGETTLPHAGQFKNVPGNKKVWDKKEPGHGAEKKSGPEGENAGAKDTMGRNINTKSEISKKVR